MTAQLNRHKTLQTNPCPWQFPNGPWQKLNKPDKNHYNLTLNTERNVHEPYRGYEVVYNYPGLQKVKRQSATEYLMKTLRENKKQRQQSTWPSSPKTPPRPRVDVFVLMVLMAAKEQALRENRPAARRWTECWSLDKDGTSHPPGSPLAVPVNP